LLFFCYLNSFIIYSRIYCLYSGDKFLEALIFSLIIILYSSISRKESPFPLGIGLWFALYINFFIYLWSFFIYCLWDLTISYSICFPCLWYSSFSSLNSSINFYISSLHFFISSSCSGVNLCFPFPLCSPFLWCFF